ncbi:MAG: adenylate/guanylate cyclase domain-containing protein [archaeon]
MKKLGFVFVFVLMFSGVLAEISISEPNAVYNLGDRLYVSLGGLVGADSGNLNIALVCNGKTTNLVKIPARAFSIDAEQSYSIPYKILDREDLEIVNLTDIVGDCQIVSSLGTQVASSNSFVVSDYVVVAVSLDKTSYNPGEEVKISVEAIKKNGARLNGFIEGSDANVFSKAITDGLAEEVFVLPKTIEAGNYYLNISAYDVGSDGVLNSGVGGVFFEVAQVASSMVMSLSEEVAIPGENFSIGVEVFDQSGVEMIGLVSLKILSPSGEGIEAGINTGEFGELTFDFNSSVGMWKVIAKFNEMVEEREFEMAALQKVEFDLEDSILSITNIGNVLYNKTISVEIGEEILKLELKIDVGEVRKFDVGAPTGEYVVFVSDGESSFSRQVLLTGNDVSVEGLREVSIFKNYSIVWIFLILILGGVGVVLLIKYRRTKTMGKPSVAGKVIDGIGNIKKNVGKTVLNKVPNNVKSHIDQSLNFTNKSPAVQGLDSSSYSGEDKTMVDLTRKNVASAESALVLKGEKLVSCVVALAVKNHEGLSQIAKENLEQTVESSKGKGLIDWRGDYVFIVFSPLVTRTYGNERLAVKAGMDIVKKLNDYNRKFKDKIEFGLGVHIGELVASKAGDKLKYTSIGNSISFAKRMSDVDSGKVVVSEAVRKKLLRDLKVVKGKEIGENMTYIVSEVLDRSGDAERLKDLIKRQG